MTVADALLLSIFVMPHGWLALGAFLVLLVIAAWPPKRNRRLR